MSKSLLAFIGGTGFDLRGPDSPFKNAYDGEVHTRFGAAAVTHAELEGRPVVFLHRHANPDNPSQKNVPPHKINYRANIAVLKKLGVTGILASTAVGGLRPEWASGTLVLLDQFLDVTTNRAKTFFDSRAVHIDVTQPYCGHLRALLLGVANELNIDLQDGGTYLCADGPRFETAAEIRCYKGWGADVVGMTGVPEATLAREAEISYVGVSIVTNAAAGIAQHPLTHEEVTEAMKLALPTVAKLFLEAARRYEDDPATEARRSTRDFAVDGYDPIDEIV
jgi:5'-methylthioadenosine phosphorylase